MEALKAGAHDCVKNRRRRLIPTIERELRAAAMRREHKQTEEELHRDREIIQQLATEMSIIAEMIIQPESIEEIADRYPSLVSTFEAGLRSMMSVPLISRDEVIGGLHFRSKNPNATPRRRSAWRRGSETRSPGPLPTHSFSPILKRPKRSSAEIVRRQSDWPKRWPSLRKSGGVIGSTLDIDEVYERGGRGPKTDSF